MKRFAELFTELDRTTAATRRLEALARYFRDAEAEDAAWAVYFLSGERLKRSITYGELRTLAVEASGIPDWLLGECHDVAGDFAETIALLLPPADEAADMSLRTVVEERIAPLKRMSAEQRAALVRQTWRELDASQRLVWHKLLLGAFRIGVGKKTVINAIAKGFGLPATLIAHRMTGAWEPSAERWRMLTGPEREDEHRDRPYPFFLASPFDGEPAELGDLHEFQAEWKYDGIRAQLLRREAKTLIYSRGDELLGEAFPELVIAGEALPEGTVLDGEILAWEGDRPLPFQRLQQRINRKRVELRLFDEVPVIFMAFDLLEQRGKDVREQALSERRAALEDIVRAACEQDEAARAIRVAPIVEAEEWDALARVRAESRERGVEGLMLKRTSSPYQVGRVRGDWWKWKIDPFTIDAVLVYAQRGHGRRVGLYTDFTFAVWEEVDGGEGARELTPFTKSYSGLTDEEFREVNAFIRDHTLERKGPVRIVEPELVFEIGFEGIQRSTRHRSGIALRFPRMLRWRRDKTAEEADTLEALRELLRKSEAGFH